MNLFVAAFSVFYNLEKSSRRRHPSIMYNFQYSPENFPRFPNVLNESEHFSENINSNAETQVTEIICGGSISINSNGQISSRCKVLFKSRGEWEKKQHFTFHTVPLKNVFKTYGKVQELKKLMSNSLDLNIDDFEIVLHGTLGLRPTNYTLSYNYGERDIVTGSFNVYGCTLRLNEANMAKRLIIETALKNLGLSIYLCKKKQKGPLAYFKNVASEICILHNPIFENILSGLHIPCVPTVISDCFQTCLSTATKKLINKDVYGLMITTQHPELGMMSYKILGQNDARSEKLNLLLAQAKYVPSETQCFLDYQKLLDTYPPTTKPHIFAISFDQLVVERRKVMNKYPFAFEFSSGATNDDKISNYKETIFRAIEAEINPIDNCRYLFVHRQLQEYLHNNFTKFSLTKNVPSQNPATKTNIANQNINCTNDLPPSEDICDLYNSKLAV